MSLLYIILALLAFGVLIFVHECGHFMTARFFGVTINEFSIGMGPKVLSRVSKKNGIRYSLRLLPIGGFVSMAGEDNDSDDPNAFCYKPVWQRIIITAAGAIMNLIFGVVVMTLLVIGSNAIGSTVVAEFQDSAVSSSYGLQEGDEILKIGNRRVHIANEVSYAIAHDGVKPLNITVRRNGEVVTLENVVFGTADSDGVTFGTMDFKVFAEQKSVKSVIKHSFYRSLNCVSMSWESFIDLLCGRYGIDALSGPVGVTGAISEAAKNGVSQFFYLLVLISMNLGIFNLIPFPALDGGRIFFMLIEWIFRRPVNRKVEAYIHFIGITVLLLFMAFITCKDILKLFR